MYIHTHSGWLQLSVKHYVETIPPPLSENLPIVAKKHKLLNLIIVSLKQSISYCPLINVHQLV